MEYCAEQGMPHSILLGWPEEDYSKLIAWLIYSKSRCPRCGSFPDDWVDSEGKEVEPPPMYVHSRKCVGCANIRSIEDRLEKEDRGVTAVFLSKTPPPPREDDDDELDDEL